MEKDDKGIEFKLSRRGFIQALGAGVGVGALAASGMSVKFRPASSEHPHRGTRFVHTLCGICGPACAAKAEVHDGRVVGLHGNPKDQTSRGKLCVKAHGAIRDLYDPDRLKYPMKRTNPRKGPDHDPGWVKISWEEAVEQCANGLNRSIATHGPESVMFVCRSNPFLNRLARAIGTPNRLSHQTTCFHTYAAPYRAMFGWPGRTWHHDLDNAKYILAMGWDGPGKAKNPHVRGLSTALNKEARLVVLDPRKTVTADLADEYHPVRPGSDLAFVLGMIHVIIKENLFNKEFIEKYTTGFDKVKALTESYTPEWASALCDIDANAIRRIAREFATADTALVVTNKRCAGGPNYANSTRLAHAQLILQCLTGVIDRLGGPIAPRGFPPQSFDKAFPCPSFPEMRKERIDGWERFPFAGSRRIAAGHFPTMASGILSDKPYKVRAAIVNKYNLLAFPNPKRAMAAFMKLDFLGAIDIMPSEIVQLADVVMPEHHWLENSAFSLRRYAAFYPQIGVRLPACEPLYDTRDSLDLWPEIGRVMGLGRYFEGVNKQKWLDVQLKAWGTSWEELQASEDGLFSVETDFRPATGFKTRSGKIELYCTAFEEAGVDPLPTWRTKKAEPCPDYPFYFLTSRPPLYRMTQNQNNEVFAQIWPENNVEIHPEPARKLGLRNGDPARVTSAVGQIVLKTKVTEAIRPDCICIMHGFGHWSRGLSVTYGKGANDGDLIPDATADEVVAAKDPGVSANMCDFCVRVEKA